jgi:uncharacterized membrane protein YeaQ/YmgE (transglycosylase-associated protein family)
MGIFSWIILGLIAGILGKLLFPGKQGGGFILTVLLGIAGAIVGGYIGTILGIGDVSSFSLKGIGIATGGSVLLMFVYRLIG